MMLRLLPLALMLAPVPLAAQDAPEPSAAPQLTLDQRMMVRCSAAFALVANRQASGEDWALAYPPLAEPGREYFVRAMAQVMDETGRGAEDLAVILREDAQNLLDRDLLDQVMPVCLTLLPPRQ